MLNVSIEANNSKLGLAFIAIFFKLTAIEQVSMHSFVDLPRYGSAKPVFAWIGRALSTLGQDRSQVWKYILKIWLKWIVHKVKRQNQLAM